MTTTHRIFADLQGVAESLRYVFIARPRCPVCESANLHTIRSRTDRVEGVTTRRTICRGCGHKFFVVIE